MTRRDHALFAGAALAGFLLAVFQVWYVALPLERQAHLDICRWTEYLDCFESLQKTGPGTLPVLAALAAVFLFEVGLAGLATGADAQRGDAWRGIARLASFPATGLAVYLLLGDFLDLKKTSPSAALLLLLSLGQNVHVLLRGRPGIRLRDGGRTALALAGAAVLFGLFLEGAAGAAREAEVARIQGQTARPAVIVPDFEQEIPRQGAVALGNSRAPIEVLLFLDPAQEESRGILADALGLRDDDVILQVYLKDRALAPDAHAVLEAAARGDPLGDPEPSTIPARYVAAAKLTEYPTAIWKGGRQSGGWTLAQILSAARGKKS